MRLHVGIWEAPVDVAAYSRLDELRIVWARQGERIATGHGLTTPEHPVDVVVCKDAAAVRRYEAARFAGRWPIPDYVMYARRRVETIPGGGQRAIADIVLEFGGTPHFPEGAALPYHWACRRGGEGPADDLGIKAALLMLADQEDAPGVRTASIAALWQPVDDDGGPT